MTRPTEHWRRVRALFDAARALPPDEHTAFLAGACPDVALRSEVEALLRAHVALQSESAGGFLSGLDFDRAAELLVDDPISVPQLDDLRPGSRLGRYVIVRRLATGGMGVVYLAQDPRLDRPTALKLLPFHASLDTAARHRFEEEARAASSLDHPNIATVYEIGDAPDGRLFIAMAYYQGETLRQELSRGPLPVPRAIDLAAQIAEGLDAAHQRGIVHRDIKPENVIVTRDGVAKIVDFGLAKMAGATPTLPGATPGTVAYMSPEQTRGAGIDARADVWSLGVVLHEMLSGERPFRGDHYDAVIYAIRHDEPEPSTRFRSDVPESLARVVRRCLSKEPADRYATAGEVAAGLTGSATPTRRATRRRRMVAIAAGVAALGAAALLAPTLVPGPRRALVPPQASTIVVIPPAPATRDSALSRLGRELAVTLSASLDGVGTIRTVPPGTVLAQLDEVQPVSVQEAAAIARRLGAASLVTGSLVRAGPLVRLDLRLLDVTDLAPLGHVVVNAPPDDIGALTDSASLTLMREIWRRGEPPVPNVSALSYRSLPALRAYLDGELALARGQYEVAVPAFERAFAADSTFWLAYWRSLYPRMYEGSRPDSAVLARLLANRHRLPDPDRWHLDAYAAEALDERLEILRAVGARYPAYWPAWYDLADALYHFGPYLGATLAEQRAAMERVVLLNPDFASAWLHLLDTTIRQRDTAAADRALRNLERTASPSAAVLNPDNMTRFRLIHGLLRADGQLAGGDAAELAQIVVRAGPRQPAEVAAIQALHQGFPRAQLQLADAVLNTQPPLEIAAAQWMAKAFAWTARGAWDSALVATEQWVRLSDDPQTALRAYGHAVVGVSIGAVETDAALGRRPGPSRMAALRSGEARAELAWLDGIVAYSRSDIPALDRALRDLEASTSPTAELLTASLVGFQLYASGERARAANALADLEWRIARRELAEPRRRGTGNVAAARFHPYFSAINRLAASDWKLELGDTLQALQLLAWHTANLAGDPAYFGVNAANRLVEPVALYRRARLEHARGRLAEAEQNYRAFLERYDLPPPQHETWVAEARAALTRLALAGQP